jgi:hypothetical protein
MQHKTEVDIFSRNLFARNLQPNSDEGQQKKNSWTWRPNAANKKNEGIAKIETWCC